MSLLAEQDLMQNLYRAIVTAKTNIGENNIVYGLFILAGILVVLVILSLVLNLRHRRYGSASPWGLFWSLCCAHKLKWSECWLLWKLARSQKLSDPAILFVEPERFASSRLTSELRPSVEKLRTIRDRIFAQPKGSIFSSGDQSPSTGSTHLTEAAVPGLKAGAELDLATWPTNDIPNIQTK